MKIRFLGTSAAGGFPNPHCRCENCQAARAEGGKSLRHQSSALIDDNLLIDLGPDVSSAVMEQGIDLANVAWVLQTHPHDDHLLPLHAVARSASWAAQEAVPMQWVGSAQTLHRITDQISPKSMQKLDMVTSGEPGEHKLTLVEIEPWQSYTFGPYRVQTVAANHDPTVSPMLFAIERDGRRMFWGTDTSTVPDGTWQRLADLGWSFDLVVFDHNDGFTRPVSPTHMGSGAMRREIGIMRDCGLVDEATKVLGTHIAHHSNGPHSVESAKAQELGYDLAWDGFVVEV
ncbi:MAG TPA: MBL fold metallo-hydrolase [Thermomicrobiales bacterium]|nr:MBL fold metallo-hydrolase [Thermomicrobiales bacterium]